MTPDTATSHPSIARLAVAYWLPAVLFVGLIYMVSSKPNLHPPVRFPWADKLAHIAEYGVLGLLLRRALRVTDPGMTAGRSAAWAIACGVVVGASDEYLQSFVPGRDTSVLDLAADAVGVTLAQWAPRGWMPE